LNIQAAARKPTDQTFKQIVVARGSSNSNGYKKGHRQHRFEQPQWQIHFGKKKVGTCINMSCALSGKLGEMFSFCSFPCRFSQHHRQYLQRQLRQQMLMLLSCSIDVSHLHLQQQSVFA